MQLTLSSSHAVLSRPSRAWISGAVMVRGDDTQSFKVMVREQECELLEWVTQEL